MGNALTNPVPTSYENFSAQVVSQYDDLPPQLQKIARFVLDNPQRVALMTIAEMSSAIGVQPSAAIRFSKALGFSGFSEIQRILKDQLTDLIPASYYERLNEQGAGEADTQIARMADLAQASLAALPAAQDIQFAAEILASARIIYVVGMRRAFGIGAYASYLLAGFGAPVHQLTGVGAMSEGPMQALGPEDAMLSISFPNYRAETMDITTTARARGVKLIALTDSPVSPVAQLADHVLLADQPVETGFRSVVGSMVTAQALAMEYGRIRTLQQGAD
ncbi:MAG: MurR/RpiR family transcriptional regulator [Paracoccaceae bacterium]